MTKRHFVSDKSIETLIHIFQRNFLPRRGAARRAWRGGEKPQSAQTSAHAAG